MGIADVLIDSAEMAAPKIIIHGDAGIGKTTLAADAKAAIMDFDKGAGRFPGRTPYIDKWTTARQLLKEEADHVSIKGPLALDTGDWCLKLIRNHVCVDLEKRPADDVLNTVGQAHGGFYKAREIITNVVEREMLTLLNKINDRGVPIIMLMHTKPTHMKTSEGFDVVKAAPFIPEGVPEGVLETLVGWADAVLYATKQGVGEAEQHVLITEGSNLVVAKNRYHLPPVLELSWGAIVGNMK